jgi:hypothetical protein
MHDYMRSSIAFDEKLADFVKSRMLLSGDPSEEVFLVPVTASELLEYLACELYRQAEFSTGRELPFSEEEMVETIRYLVLARVWYVSGGHAVTHPKELVYPALFGPILAQIGKFHHELGNYTIIPVPADESFIQKGEDGQIIGINRKKKLEASPILNTVTRALAALGVQTAYGLPMDKQIEVDDIFRLDVINDVLLGKADDRPAPHLAISRMCLKMTYLHSLYGMTRISYGMAMSNLKAPIEELVLRHIRGPSVRLSPE